MINNQRLTLKKTHDFNASGKPRLAVICIHGIAADSSSYTKALAYWEKEDSLRDVRFLAFDLLGAGESMASDELKYDYAEQLEALHNSIEDLELDVPLVLVGHSMGTLIITRYANTHKKSVRKLILISPPIYTEQDFDNPIFQEGTKAFCDAVRAKSRAKTDSRQFDASMKHIVSDKRNYKVLAELKTPAVLIYGFKDTIIVPHNIPKILKANPDYLTAIRTDGLHGVSIDKYIKVPKILREILNEDL